MAPEKNRKKKRASPKKVFHSRFNGTSSYLEVRHASLRILQKEKYNRSRYIVLNKFYFILV